MSHKQDSKYSEDGDSAILTARELILAANELPDQGQDANEAIDLAITSVMSAVSCLAALVAKATGCTSEPWTNPLANETSFTGPDDAVAKLREYEEIA